MKKILFIAVCAAVLCGCGKENNENKTQIPHFICCYENVALVAEWECYEPDHIVLCVKTRGKYEHYCHVGANLEKFKELAERHGDLNYKGGFHYGKYDFYYISDELSGSSDSKPEVLLSKDFEAVNIVADKDWDDTHPAGASLNDLFEFSVDNCYKYIENGYTGVQEYKEEDVFPGALPLIYRYAARISKPVAELQSGDMWCLYGYYIITFSLPAAVEYPQSDEEFVFTVTLTTYEGEEIVLEAQPFVFGQRD